MSSSSTINKWKNHLVEMKGDVRTSVHEKGGKQVNATPTHKTIYNPIPTSAKSFQANSLEIFDVYMPLSKYARLFIARLLIREGRSKVTDTQTDPTTVTLVITLYTSLERGKSR